MNPHKNMSNIPHIRPVVFWDTNLEKLDWEKYREFIIKRILERGSAQEIRDMKAYYGIEDEKDEKEDSL